LATKDYQCDEVSSFTLFEQNIRLYDLVIHSGEYDIIPTYTEFLYAPCGSFTFTILYSRAIASDSDGTIEELFGFDALGFDAILGIDSISPTRCVSRYGGWSTTVPFDDLVFFPRGQIIHGSLVIGGIARCNPCGSEAMVSGTVNRVIGELITVTPTGYLVRFRGSLFVERPLRSAVEANDYCCY